MPCSSANCGNRHYKWTYGTVFSGGSPGYYTGGAWALVSDCNASGADYICSGSGSTPPGPIKDSCSGAFTAYHNWLCGYGGIPGVDCQHNGPHEITGTGLGCFDVACTCADSGNCGTLTCEPSETCCNDTSCIPTASLQTDENNCGGCGIVCPEGQICVDAVCVPDCPAVTCSWTWDDKDWGCCKVFLDNGALYAVAHDVVCDTTVVQPPHVFGHYTFSPTPCTDLGILPAFMTDPMQFSPIDFNFVITENIAALWRAGDLAGFRAANTAAAPAGYAYNSADNFSFSGTYALHSNAPVTISYYANWYAIDPSNPIANLNSSATYAGTASPDRGVWIATTTCPTGCNCPADTPTIPGTTDGQVVSHPCSAEVCDCGPDDPPDPDPTCGDSVPLAVAKPAPPVFIQPIPVAPKEGPCIQGECEEHISTWMAEASGELNQEGLYKVVWILLDGCPGACCSDQPTQPEFVKKSELIDAPCKCGCS